MRPTINMWKVLKFILFVFFVSFSFNVAKGRDGEVWQVLILLLAIGVGYYVFYILPDGGESNESEYDDERH